MSTVFSLEGTNQAETVIAEFFNYLRNVRHLTSSTERCYKADIYQFCKFLIDVTLFTTTHQNISDYLSFLEKNNYSKQTLARKVSSLRTFYKFALLNKLVEHDPTKGIKVQLPQRLPPKLITEEQKNKLVENISGLDLIGLRDKAIIEMLYSTGMRSFELIGLNIGDVDTVAGFVKIKSPGKKDRTLPLNKRATESCLKYIRARFPYNLPDQALFVNKHGQHISARSIRRKIEYHAKKANIQCNVNPSSLRHSFAINSLSCGINLITVQEKLGYMHPSSSINRIHYDLKA